MRDFEKSFSELWVKIWKKAYTNGSKSEALNELFEEQWSLMETDDVFLRAKENVKQVILDFGKECLKEDALNRIKGRKNNSK